MPARRPLAVSAPGKLILMGEHAAVYGRPALIAAIDLRLTARFSPLPPGETRKPEVQLDLPGLGHVESTSWEDLRAYARATRDRWDRYAERPAPEGFREVRGEDRAHVVKIALGEVAEALSLDGSLVTDVGLHLRVESTLPIGSGFGSSAATATAVVAGLLAWSGREDEPDRIAHLALEVERRQHGLPSGVDGVTVLHGGVLWARRLESGRLEVDPLTIRSPLLDSLRVYDTGTPAETTGAVVAAVRALRERDPARHEELLDRMEAATRAFRDLLQGDSEDPEADPDRALHLIRDHEACLEGLGVVPEQVRNLVRQVEDEGGAAKISGAGALSGPGAGSLLVYHPDRERVARWTFLRPFSFHPVHLGAPGFRREAFG